MVKFNCLEVESVTVTILCCQFFSPPGIGQDRPEFMGGPLVTVGTGHSHSHSQEWSEVDTQ